MSGTRRRAGIIEEDIDDTDDEMSIQERQDLQYATNLSIHDIYMAEQGYRQVPHPRMEPTRTRNLSRTQSVKEGFGKFTRREKGPSREEIDPSIYRQQDVYQQKLKNMWNPKKLAKSAKHAIGKFFIYQNIAPNKAQGPYYQCMIDEIARAGVGVEGPTPYKIGGSILEDEIEELKEYIDEFKKKWEVYGVILMCDGWTSITHLSITNFLIYCDGKTVFHKSVNITGIDKDANYLFQLMDEVVQEIGEKYVVQIITDNQSSYKRAAELLMDRRPHLYWTSCAAHSLDLVLHDLNSKVFHLF
ncbi:HAT family dimerization domain containing protein [Quillaja saponaria]|uniref:HAT family dimerization domain containing protein n=1 Tax=Quillaja saponaria TaxID=32244 RepID=A0AAD7PYM4_QUISA|nr:HAT family dimerization domain containing protein [Quillaja saponaria]